MWLSMVISAFVDSIRQHDALALVLLADWSVCLKGVEHVWWTRGWSKRTLEAVWQDVGDEHCRLLIWVAIEVGVDLYEPIAA
jgi:hypothetical protein